MRIVGYLTKGAASLTGDIFIYDSGEAGYNHLMKCLSDAGAAAHMPMLPVDTVAVVQDCCGNRRAIWRRKHHLCTGTHISFKMAGLPKVINVNSKEGRIGDSGEWLVYSKVPSI